MARIEIEIKTTRSLTSFLGRKRIFLAPYSQGVLNSAYAWPSQSTIGELTNRALAKIYNFLSKLTTLLFVDDSVVGLN